MTQSESKKCPMCGAVVTEKSSARPFCSDRCKLLDLGAWAAERYRVAGEDARKDSTQHRAQDEEDDVQ